MRLHDLTLPTIELNLALDEALLLAPAGGDTLRFWEPETHSVVLGRSSRYYEEANAEACQQRGVSIRRRVSGGASIVAGPGCLMYAVVLDARERPELLDLDKAHHHVLSRLVTALKPLESTVTIAGTSDLAIENEGLLQKFSGNSLRRVRERLLYHGTLLYDFDLPLIDELLQVAPRQPDYRAARDHHDFVTNLKVQPHEINAALAATWQAEPAEVDPSVLAAAEQLVPEKYALPSWNESR